MSFSRLEAEEAESLCETAPGVVNLMIRAGISSN